MVEGKWPHHQHLRNTSKSWFSGKMSHSARAATKRPRVKCIQTVHINLFWKISIKILIKNALHVKYSQNFGSGQMQYPKLHQAGQLEWWSNIHYSKIFHINQSQHRPVFKSKSIHWAFEILLRNYLIWIFHRTFYLIWIFHRTFYLQPFWKSFTLSGNSFSGPKCCCQKKL